MNTEEYRARLIDAIDAMLDLIALSYVLKWLSALEDRELGKLVGEIIAGKDETNGTQ